MGISLNVVRRQKVTTRQLLSLNRRHPGARQGWSSEGIDVLSNVELIVAALGTGAAAGLTNTASAAVKDAYIGLKRLLRPWVRGHARQVLEGDETEPEVWRAQIGEELMASGADTDEEILAMARRLLALADPKAADKYRVQISHAKGVQIGDHNTQTNNF